MLEEEGLDDGLVVHVDGSKIDGGGTRNTLSSHIRRKTLQCCQT